MLNRITLIGRITKNPELRTTNNGKDVVEISIAVNKRIKPKDGSADADFFRVTAWESTARFISEYLGRGRLIAVDGRLETRKYTDKEGNAREVVFVVADNVHSLDRPKENNRKANHDEDVREPVTGQLGDEYDPFADE
jgi:single-strand DNA-binding protein